MKKYGYFKCTQCKLTCNLHQLDENGNNKRHDADKLAKMKAIYNRLYPSLDFDARIFWTVIQMLIVTFGMNWAGFLAFSVFAYGALNLIYKLHKLINDIE